MHSVIHNISLILTFRPCSLLQRMTKYSRLLTETAAHLHITTEYQGLEGGSSHIRACGFYVEDYIEQHVSLCPCYLKPLHFTSSHKKLRNLFFCNMMMHNHIIFPPPHQNKSKFMLAQFTSRGVYQATV